MLDGTVMACRALQDDFVKPARIMADEHQAQQQEKSAAEQVEYDFRSELDGLCCAKYGAGGKVASLGDKLPTHKRPDGEYDSRR